MKIMHEQEPWPRKVNFVDDLGTFLGFDTEDDCCANGGWFLADTADANLEETFRERSMELPGFMFDPDYYRERPEVASEGAAVQFRMFDKEGREKFLTLYNHHNGYYGKGFKIEVPVDPTRNREGTL